MKKIYLFTSLCLLAIITNAQTFIGQFTTNISGQSIKIEANKTTSKVRLTMTGATSGYFAFGFDSGIMADAYAIVCNSSNGVFEERILGNHNVGTKITSSFTLISDTDLNNIKTIVLERDLKGPNAGYFDFSNIVNGTKLDIIFSKGSSKTLAYHGGPRGTAIITFETMIVGIDKTKPEINLSVFPNPTQNEFTVSFDKEISNTKITVLNEQYAPIKSQTFENAKSMTISIEELKAGTYFIAITKDTYTYFDRIVKQ